MLLMISEGKLASSEVQETKAEKESPVSYNVSYVDHT